MTALSSRLSIVIMFSLLCCALHSHPLPTDPSLPSVFHTDTYKQALRTRPRKPPGVWRITKYSSILGPTLAIFLYGKARDLIERHEPFLSAKLQDFVQRTSSDGEDMRGTSFASFSPVGGLQNPYVMKIANEIVRLTNRRLRERAVLSRIQMDDDQYEFSRRASASDMKETLLQVTADVLTRGSGHFLKPDEKRAVRRIVSSSVY